jgi:hypothetical protein
MTFIKDILLHEIPEWMGFGLAIIVIFLIYLWIFKIARKEK